MISADTRRHINKSNDVIVEIDFAKGYNKKRYEHDLQRTFQTSFPFAGSSNLKLKTIYYHKVSEHKGS